MTFIKDPEVRKWIYGIIVAVIPLLVINGLLSNEEASQYLFLAAAILGLGGAGLALPNTPSRVKGKHEA
jgi:hypothetical protein